LPYLLVKRTNGKEPLVDYSQSHVVTSKCCNLKRVFEDYAIKVHWIGRQQSRFEKIGGKKDEK
jgi:hypothetical protein